MAVTPSHGQQTVIPPTQYRSLLRWHLGIPLLPRSFEGTTCPMGCGASIDVFGDHLVCCRRNKLWERHYGIQEFISRCLHSHCLPHRLEEVIDNNDRCQLRTDVTLLRWERGTDVAIDIAVCHPCPLSLDTLTPQDARQVLDTRVTRKVTKYGERCSNRG